MEKSQLNDIRTVIDEADAAILAFLEMRFAAVEKVRALKSAGSRPAQSPIRPAREAQILRRLAKLKGKHVPLDHMVRLWRCILSAATGLQAPVTLHAGGEAGADASLRDLASGHFSGIPLVVHPSDEEALASLAMTAIDVAVVRPSGTWVAPFLAGRGGGARVMGSLPAISARDPSPLLLVLGHCEAEPTGDDETLVIARRGADASQAGKRLWSVAAGESELISFAGFLSEADAKGAVIAGRYPRPLDSQ